jgi:Leucine rich repeat
MTNFSNGAETSEFFYIVRVIFASLLIIEIISAQYRTFLNRNCWYYDRPNDLKCNYGDVSDNLFNENFNWLKILSMTNNKIQMLSSQTFNGLVGLKGLNLDDNEIPDLPDGVFKPLESIETINIPF